MSDQYVGGAGERRAQPLVGVRSIKVKLGLLVAASATVAALVAALGRSDGVPPG